MNCENYDPSFPDQPVVDLYLPVWATLPAFHSKPVFIWAEDGDEESPNSIKTTMLTYTQLNDSVHSIASHLTAQFQRGDTVLVLCSPGLELVQVIFGCQRAGLLSVPLVPPHPSFAKELNYRHLLRVLSQTKPKAAIASAAYINSVLNYLNSSSTDKKLAQLLQNLAWVSSDKFKANKVLDKKFDPLSYNGCKQEDLYLIQYTSGSTEIPKPVLVTAGSAAHNVRTARKAYDLHPNSTIVSWLPQYHDCGLMFLLLTIVSGATCVLMSPFAFLNRPRLWLEVMSDFKATCTPVPSFTLPLVLKRGGIDKGTEGMNLSSVKNLIIINEPIYKPSVEEFLQHFSRLGLSPTSISPSYGLAENCTFVCTAWRRYHDSPAAASFMDNLPEYNKLLPVARLASSCNDVEEEDMEIIIVDENTCELVEDGTEGEIWIQSPSNTSGYLDHPSLTREVFHGRIRNKVGRCYLRTGDRGIVKGEERFLFVTGRCADIIKLHNGREVHPHYIETAAYNSCPSFLRGGCIAAFEIAEEIVIVAEMQRNEKYAGPLTGIIKAIKETVLKEENVEIGLVVLVSTGSVPKTTSGKLQRWAAKEKFIAGKMKILMEMQFGEDDNIPSHLFRMRIHEKQGRKLLPKEKEDIFLSFSINPTGPSLRSHL